MPRKNQVICPITKIECDSKEEMYFLWWLVELEKAGYIKKFKRSSTHSLSEKEYYKLIENGVEKLKTLLEPHEYTPDFVIAWSDTAKNFFYCEYNKVNQPNIPFIIYKQPAPISIIDVKGHTFQRFDKTGSLKSFEINRKWLFKDRSLFVEIVEIKSLFRQTFTPKRYLFTDKSERPRKIGWKIRSLEEYINIRKKIIDNETS